LKHNHDNAHKHRQGKEREFTLLREALCRVHKTSMMNNLLVYAAKVSGSAACILGTKII